MMDIHTYSSRLRGRRWLSGNAFEIEISKPASFTFIPGQCIRFMYKGLERDYTMVSTPADQTLALCIRDVPAGRFTSFLVSAETGTLLSFTGPHGYFTYRPSDLPSIFIATGTGIAPFVSMSRSGISGFTVLHGVREPGNLYYKEVFRHRAVLYVPCITAYQTDPHLQSDFFNGRVTGYLEHYLPRRPYDFYLCGQAEMIRDVMLLVDDLFPESRVYSESFF